MPTKKGPPEEDAPISEGSFNAPKASQATLVKLLEALNAPQPTEAAPRPLHPVAGIAGSIIGALDPEGYERLVRPAVAERKTEARRQYETAREQRGEDIENLAAIHQLQLGEEKAQERAKADAVEESRRAEAHAWARERFMDEQAAEDSERLADAEAFQAAVLGARADFEMADRIATELMNHPDGEPESDVIQSLGRDIYAAKEAARGMLQWMTEAATADPESITKAHFVAGVKTIGDVAKKLQAAREAKERFAAARLSGALVADRQEAARSHKVAIRTQKVEENVISLMTMRASLMKARELNEKYGEGAGDLGGPLEYRAPVRWVQQALGLERAKDTSVMALHLSNAVYGYITANAGKAFTANEAVWLNPALIKMTDTYTDRSARIDQQLSLVEAKIEGYMQEFDYSPEHAASLMAGIDAAIAKPGTTGAMILNRMAPKPRLAPSVKTHVPAPADAPPGLVGLPFMVKGMRAYYDPNSNSVLVDDPNAP